MRDFRLQCPITPASGHGGRTYRDHWRLYDTVTEFLAQPVRCDFNNPKSRHARNKLRDGDTSLVAGSDKMLRVFEAAAAELLAPARPIRPAVVGGAWDIPAVVTGVPLAARARVRAAKTNAPLTVLVDCGCSGGIYSEQMAERGACILALVRLLSRNRVVTLWVGETNTDVGDYDTLWDFMRVDTNPLDIARAAFMLTTTEFTRQVIWSVLPLDASWPRVVGRQIRGDEMSQCARPWAGDTLCIEAAHLRDPLLADPIAWLMDKLTKLQ